MYTCCFIGHRKIDDTPELRNKLEKTLLALLENGVREFIFGSRSQFDDLCYDLLTELKKVYPDIKRIKYRSDYPGELSEYSKQFFLDGYEDNICPEGVEGAGRLSYVKRNEAMIMASDICVSYYDKNYQPKPRKISKNALTSYQLKSGTRIAFEFAVQKNKKIINLYDETVYEQNNNKVLDKVQNHRQNRKYRK